MAVQIASAQSRVEHPRTRARTLKLLDSDLISGSVTSGGMHAATRRLPPALEVKLDPAVESAPLALPGLVSSLRPIRRSATQLADEAALLRRFMYKHKNQHKGQRWWRRIVEVDRCTSKALAELSGWLAGLGMRCASVPLAASSKGKESRLITHLRLRSPDKEDHGSLGPQGLCRGLLAAPRVLLIVEKVRPHGPYRQICQS